MLSTPVSASTSFLVRSGAAVRTGGASGRSTTSAPLWILTHKDQRTTARVRALRDHPMHGVAEKRGVIEGKQATDTRPGGIDVPGFVDSNAAAGG